MLFFTEKGRCYWLNVYEIPEGDKTSKGRAIQNLIQLPPDDKIRAIIEDEGGHLETVFAIMGPWDFFAIVKYPDTETAFRVLAKIGLLEVVQTETFPAEEVDVFVKAFA